MAGYLVGVIIVLLATSALMVWVLNKYKLLKTSIVLETTASSFAVSIIFPSLFSYFGVWVVFPVIIIALLLATVIYIANNYQDNGVQSILQSCSALAAGYFGLEGLIKNKPEDLKLDSEKQFAETDLKMNEKTNIAGTSCFAEPDNVEKSVDSGLLTDKMGLGSDNYILTAFEQKQAGDYEGAILYYLFALDNDPAIEDVFWILLDICALYKELRQPDMAKEMLDNYSSKYEDIINEDIRDQIISNL